MAADMRETLFLEDLHGCESDFYSRRKLRNEN